ncbi:Histone-fold-containing protein [Rhodotorula toruloides]|uniref:Histone-fold-containing protein n=1 Tax=Rhodotorula toruloides TaxID=5286 RepID=A0A2S9ZX44_RHOTO|nr:Histone-fold-containing protein [Rhodotorula toruloides]
MNVAEHHEDDFKHQALPLARIKKVAKMDPEVQNTMISSEVTILFEKACQIFIQELTARAHLVSMSAKRRTISRADVAQAVSRSDMFDFLIVRRAILLHLSRARGIVADGAVLGRPRRTSSPAPNAQQPRPLTLLRPPPQPQAVAAPEAGPVGLGERRSGSRPLKRTRRRSRRTGRGSRRS